MFRVVSFDPSGNVGKEGDGTTGVAVFVNGQLKDFCSVASSDYDTQEEYWDAVADEMVGANAVVCESYRLFASKAKQQSWSTMDTPQLIGFLRMTCWHNHVPFCFQDPSDKVRVADPILLSMGVIEQVGRKFHCMGRPTNLHIRDAIRHGIFWHRWGKGKNYANQFTSLQ